MGGKKDDEPLGVKRELTTNDMLEFVEAMIRRSIMLDLAKRSVIREQAGSWLKQHELHFDNYATELETAARFFLEGRLSLVDQGLRRWLRGKS